MPRAKRTSPVAAKAFTGMLQNMKILSEGGTLPGGQK
jgi:hypothetical protein